MNFVPEIKLWTRYSALAETTLYASFQKLTRRPILTLLFDIVLDLYRSYHSLTWKKSTVLSGVSLGFAAVRVGGTEGVNTIAITDTSYHDFSELNSGTGDTIHISNSTGSVMSMHEKQSITVDSAMAAEGVFTFTESYYCVISEPSSDIPRNPLSFIWIMSRL